MTHPLPAEVWASSLRRYSTLFVNRRDTFLSLSLVGHWVRRRQPLTDRYLSAALAGHVALGLYSVDAEGGRRWACLDVDDPDQGTDLWRMLEQLEEPRQALLETSRRGWHLWLFVDPAPWAEVRHWAVQLASQAGLKGIEVFPKGPGLNGVRAPLTPHPKDGATYPVIDLTTGEIATDPWGVIAACQPHPLPATQPHEKLPPPLVPAGWTEHRELMDEIARYTRLRYYGPERAVGCCPFHDDRHPSLGVIGGYWRCFAGCGSGGLAAFRRLVISRGW